MNIEKLTTQVRRYNGILNIDISYSDIINRVSLMRRYFRTKILRYFHVGTYTKIITNFDVILVRTL